MMPSVGDLRDKNRSRSARSRPKTEASIGGDVQRLDKWLWYARVAKSRTLAAALVTRGKIRVNRERVSRPSQNVRIGDVVTAAVGRSVRVLRIEAAGTRRGPAQEARALYEDLTPLEDRPKSAVGNRSGHTAGRLAGPLPGRREPGSGRPTKRDRRLLDKWRQVPD